MQRIFMWHWVLAPMTRTLVTGTFLFHRTSAMNIQITPTARERMQSFLQRHPDAPGVRFGVRRTGCSGFGYVIELAEERRDDDQTLQVDGVPLIVDARSQPLVDGTVIDFQRQGLNTHFVFHNPNATGECGCGESFTVDAPHD